MRRCSARSIPVASVKGAIGECGASGAAGLIAGLLSLADGAVVPTAGLSERDPALAVCVSSRPQAVARHDIPRQQRGERRDQLQHGSPGDARAS